MCLHNMHIQFSWSLTCVWLCDARDCSTLGLPVHHQLPELAQTPVHWLSQQCHPISSSCVIAFSSCFQSFPAWGSFPVSQFFTSHGQSLGASASASVLSVNIQDQFPLGLTGWISLQSKGLWTPWFKSIISSLISFLYSPSLTSIHDCWKNESFDYTDLCQQSNVSAF